MIDNDLYLFNAACLAWQRPLWALRRTGACGRVEDKSFQWRRKIFSSKSVLHYREESSNSSLWINLLPAVTKKSLHQKEQPCLTNAYFLFKNARLRLAKRKWPFFVNQTWFLPQPCMVFAQRPYGFCRLFTDIGS